MSNRLFVQEERSNMLKMAKYLDLLEVSAAGLGKNVFNRFCQFLLDRFPLIHAEVTVELKAVRGELSIEEHLREEAHILVQREFNDIKRLKDFEKKEIEDLVATRMQVHKEIWTRAIGEATRHQQEERLTELNKKGSLVEMGKRFENFIRINDKDGTCTTSKQKQATENVGDIEVTKEPLSTMKQLVKDIDLLKELSLKNLAARNEAMEEKTRALRVLGVSSTTPTRLDKEVEAVLEPLEREEKDLEEQLMLRQHQTEELRTKLNKIEEARRQEEEDLDEQMRIQKDIYDMTHTKSQSDRSQMFVLQRQLARVMERLSRFQSKSTMLHRGRSMGYATNDVLERVKVLRAFTSSSSSRRLSRAQLSKTPRRVTYSRSLDRKPTMPSSHRSTS